MLVYKTNHGTKIRVEGSRSCTSGWGVCIGADRTGSTDETTEFKGNDVTIAAAVNTAWASGSSVSPGEKVGNTCSGNTVVSS